MGTTAKRLKLRCFLEGQEVPIIAANIQVAPNSPMIASLQLPPLSEGTKLKPRTLVHVFFLDFWTGAPSDTYKRGDSIDATDRGPAGTYDYSLARYKDGFDQEEGQDLVSDMKNQQYKLLFGGEMVGFEWTKSPTHRSLVLQCQDWSNYWDYAMQFKNTDLFGPGYKAMFSGGGTNLFTDFLSGPGEVITGLLKQPSIQYPKLKGLLGGIVHVLEAIGGAYYTKNGKTFAGQNIFFSVAELRLKLTQMITAYEDDPSCQKLLGGSYDGLYGRTIGNLGEQVSFRKVVNALLGIIFHESYGQPCPLYSPGKEGNIDGYTRTNISDDPELNVLVSDADSLIESLSDIKTTVSGGANDDPKSQKNELILSMKKAKKGCQDTNTKAVKLKFNKATRLLTEAKTSIGQAENKVRAKWKADVSSATTSEINAKLDDAIRNLRLIRELQVSKTNRKNAFPARLNQQIFRPDVWFTAPPRCNVLFPEQYTTLNYARSLLQEPTRLLLKTNDEFFGEDALFDCFYFAPKIEGLKSGKAELNSMLAGDIMSHEIYTGILPIFEKMGEFNIFGVRSGTAPSSKKPTGKSGNGKVPSGKKVKVGLAQRSTNFLFFRYRFAARQMTVQGTFNPYVACGFPGFIIDKYVDLNKLRQLRDMMVAAGYKYRPLTDMLGTHFLGNFTQVTHILDQSSGGNTLYQIQFPREYNEEIEFLGASNKQTQQVEKRMDERALRTTDVAAIDPPPFGALGPQFGVIAVVDDVTGSYASGEGDQAQRLPLYTGPRRSGTGELTTKVLVGVAKPASEWGPEVVEMVGSPNKMVSFKAYRVQEAVPRYRREKILVPAEELIRPGWYGDCWHPSLIGKVYEKFFRTGAITDPQQVSDPAGASTGVPQQDAEDALATAASGTEFDDPRSQAPAIMSLESESSIQQACSFLIQVYSYIRMNELSTEDFIRSYTWRPIASMIDMFGSSDLELDDDGSKVIRGIEGFHSRAFGPWEDLFALVTPEIETVVGVKRGSTLAKKGDRRKEKWEAVRSLVDALTATRAILG